MMPANEEKGVGGKQKVTSASQALVEALTTNSHEDPGKHVIGEALPVASDEEIQPVGIAATAGSSPNPARADHTHAIQAPFSVVNIPSPALIPFGGTRYYIDNLDAVEGEDWVGVSQQTIEFQNPGLYIIGIYMEADNNAGGGAALGAGYFDFGITFSGAIAYGFRREHPDPAQTYFYSDVTHFHSQVGTGYMELWMDNFLAVDIRIPRLQIVVSYMST